MHRAVCIYLLQNMKTIPSSPIEIKASALMLRHVDLLHRQTSLWIFSYLSNGLSTFHCDIPGFNLNCAGIVYFKNTSLLSSIPDMLNTFDHALGASVLLNVTKNVFSPFIADLKKLINIVFTTRLFIEVVVNDPKIEQYAPQCFKQVAEYSSSLTIVFGKEQKLYNKLPFILKICEYISMHILSIHGTEYIKFMPQKDKIINSCQSELFIPQNDNLFKSYIGVGKLQLTELFGEMVMPLVQSYLQSFSNSEELLSVFQLTDLEALETYMIVWQDTLMSLNVVDIQYGDFIPDLANHLKAAYIDKDRKELLSQVSLMFKTPPSAYRITDHDRMFIKRIFPRAHNIREFRNFTKATLEAYSDDTETINDNIYALPSVIISGQAKTVVSICHELIKQFIQDPVANNQSAHHCKDLLNSIRNLLYTENHINGLNSACIAFNDLSIYFLHHLILLQKLLADGQSNCMEIEFKLSFLDLVDLFESRGNLLLRTELMKSLNKMDKDYATMDLRNIWMTLKEYLSVHGLIKCKEMILKFVAKEFEQLETQSILI